jgi:hypothetical protein
MAHCGTVCGCLTAADPFREPPFWRSRRTHRLSVHVPPLDATSRVAPCWLHGLADLLSATRLHLFSPLPGKWDRYSHPFLIMSTRPSRASRPKKKQQPKKPRTRQRTQNRALVRQPRVNLSHCALAYAKALADPFDYGANELPCIPDMIDQPSFRCVVRTRGIITTNAAGFASLLVNPLAAASDRSFIIATDSAYVGTTVPGIGGTGANTITNTQFPYTAAGARPHRTVSAALRVRYWYHPQSVRISYTSLRARSYWELGRPDVQHSWNSSRR